MVEKPTRTGSKAQGEPKRRVESSPGSLIPSSTRFLVRHLGSPPAAFRTRLSSPKVEAILADYERRGGNRALLLGVLYQLFETFDPTATSVPRPFKTTLKRCKKDLSALLDFNISNLRGHSLGLLFFADQTVKEIDRALRILEAKRTRGRPRGPGGASTDSLVVAFLAAEFTRFYNDPRYDWISVLVQSVAPSAFPPAYSTPRHLRMRVRSVPPEALTELNDNVARAFLTLQPAGKKENQPKKKSH